MRYLFLLLLGVFILSCSGRINRTGERLSDDNADSAIVINADYPEIKDTVYISQIADTLFYVQLEKNSQCNLEYISKVYFSESVILVQNLFSLYMFSGDGSYIRTLALDKCWGFDVLEKEQLIFVAYENGIRVCDYEGNLISKIPTKIEGIGYFVAALDTETAAVSIWNTGTEENRLAIIKSDGSIVKEFPNYDRFKSNNLPITNASRFQRSLFHYGDEVRYHPYYSDTLFSIREGELIPVFIENKIKKAPVESRLEYIGDYDMFDKINTEQRNFATRFFETSRYIFVSYYMARLDQSLPSYLLYDRQTKELYNFQLQLDYSRGNIHFGIYNDYDGGMPFCPEYNSDEYLIQVHRAKKFIDEYKNGRDLLNCNSATGACTVEHYDVRSKRSKTSLHREAFDGVFAGLKEDGNPVLMIAKLKNIDK